MSQYAVVYWSGTGNTEAMADAIAQGLEAKGETVKTFTSSVFTLSEVANFDGFAFGCSSSGAESLEEQEFLPMWEAVSPALKGKKVALFGSYGWGGGEWMEAWKAESEEAGISIVNTLICQGEPDDEGVENCKKLADALLA